MKPKGPILSFATSLPYSTAMRPHICESPCMSMQEKRCKARHRFHVSQDPACFVLPRASWCWDAQTCCCRQSKSLILPQLMLGPTWRTIHFACGSFMQCWPWSYKSNLASQTDKSINWYPCSGFGRLPSCRHTIPWWKLVRASDTNTPE